MRSNLWTVRSRGKGGAAGLGHVHSKTKASPRRQMGLFVPTMKKVPIPTPEILAHTPVEQVKRYRQLAADAEQWASTSPAPAHRPYPLMAERWRKLADEIEADLKQ